MWSMYELPTMFIQQRVTESIQILNPRPSLYFGQLIASLKSHLFLLLSPFPELQQKLFNILSIS